MYEKKLSFKEHIALFGRLIRLINSISPCAISIQFLYCFFKAVIPLFTVFMTARIIDEIVSGSSENRLIFLVVFTIGLGFFAVILQGVFGYILSQLKVRIFAKQDFLLESKAYALSYEDAECSEINILRKQIETNAENGVGGLFEAIWFSNNLFRYASAVVISLGMCSSLIFKVTWWMLLILLLFVILSIVVITFNFNRVNQVIRTLYESSADASLLYDFYMVDYVDENRSAKDIRVMGQKDFLREELRLKMYDPRYQVRKNQIRAEGNHSILTVGLTAVLGGLVYIFVTIIAWNGQLNAGSVIQYYGAITQMIGSAASLVVAMSALLDNNYCLQPLFRYLDLPEPAQKDGIQFPETQKVIELKNVTYYYVGCMQPALDNVCLEIKHGERIAVVGRNGSGKTTLAKVLCNLLTPQSGVVTVNETNFEMFNPASIRQYMSVVFQDFRLLPFSVGQNVAGTDKYQEEKVWKTLDKVGMRRRVERMPKQLNQPIYKDFTEDGVELSGGEEQKMAIARALYKDTGYIVFDEPTAALDPLSEAEIYKNLNQIIADKTVIFISHRLASCKFCDKIVVMDKGKIIETGTHEELLSDINSMYSFLWNAQVKNLQKDEEDKIMKC